MPKSEILLYSRSKFNATDISYKLAICKGKIYVWPPRWRHRPRISLCLGSCQLSRGFEESGNQSNKQISANVKYTV